MTDKSREQFEEWWHNNFSSHSLSAKTLCFDAWQASRAALVVQFTTETYFSPCKTDLELAHDDGFNSAMNSVKAELDMAGVKYK